MYYGLYSNVRNSAWQCLIDFNVSNLPVDVMKIARLAGVYVVKNSKVNMLREKEHGRSFFDGETWITVYNDDDSEEITRFAIAHELGHFFLGHALAYAKYADKKEFSKKPHAEQEADMFALRLLCPACVIRDLNITDAEDIARICEIPHLWAERRFRRLRELNQRRKYFTSPVECEVYNRFNTFLSEYKSNV